jgi:hypothetical protein
MCRSSARADCGDRGCRLPGNTFSHGFTNCELKSSRECCATLSFRSLCEDYGVAVQARGFWKQSARNDAAERAREYKALMIDLEKEISRGIGHGDDA